MARPDEYYFKEGCFIEEWHNLDSDPECSVARVRVKAGKTTKLHLLQNTTERYVMLSGSATVTVGEESWCVSDGDVVVIPPNIPQKIENLEQSDLIFFAICTPRFDVSNYKECRDEETL